MMDLNSIISSTLFVILSIFVFLVIGGEILLWCYRLYKFYKHREDINTVNVYFRTKYGGVKTYRLDPETANALLHSKITAPLGIVDDQNIFTLKKEESENE